MNFLMYKLKNKSIHQKTSVETTGDMSLTAVYSMYSSNDRGEVNQVF